MMAWNIMCGELGSGSVLVDAVVLYKWSVRRVENECALFVWRNRCGRGCACVPRNSDAGGDVRMYNVRQLESERFGFTSHEGGVLVLFWVRWYYHQ